MPPPYQESNNYVVLLLQSTLNHMLKPSIDLPDQPRFQWFYPILFSLNLLSFKPSYSELRACTLTEPKPVQLEPRNTPRPLHPSPAVYPSQNYRAPAESIYPEPKPYQARHVLYCSAGRNYTRRVAYDYSPVEYRSMDYGPRPVVYNANQRVGYITDDYNHARSTLGLGLEPAEYNFQATKSCRVQAQLEETLPRPVEYNRRGSNVAHKHEAARIAVCHQEITGWSTK